MITLSVLLVEDDPDYAALVQHWLSTPDDDTHFALEWSNSLGAAKARLGKGGIDVVLLDLGLPDSEGIDTFAELRHLSPGLPIIVLSAADSESLALGTIQSGAQDYLVKSRCDRGLLAKSVRYAHVRQQCHPKQASVRASSPSKVIALFGAKGGVGVTTVACSLATELRNQTGKRVLLADLDLHGGMASFLLGFEPAFALWDVVEHAVRMDGTFSQTVLTPCSERLDLIGSSAVSGSRAADWNDLRQMVRFARPLYDWIVLDLGRLSPQSMGLLEDTSAALLVTTPGIPALYQAKQLVDYLTGTPFARDRLHLVINQSAPQESLEGSDIGRLFGTYIFANLPSDAHALHQAVMKKTVPAEGSPLRKGVIRLACKLAGVEEPKGGIPQFLSFLRPRSRQGQAQASGNARG